MFEKFLNDGNFKNLISSIENGDNCSVFGLNLGEKLALVKDSAFLFFVCENINKVYEVEEKLSSLGRKCEILTDCINVLTDEFTQFDKTLKTLYRIKSGNVDTLIITPEVMCQKFFSPKSMSPISLNVGDEINVSNLSRKLIENN